MPRSYMALQTTTWGDGDFERLSLAEQSVYMRVGSHPKISACGVLDMPVRRLTRMACGLTTPELQKHIARLVETDYLVCDPSGDTDELLVRSFIRHDGRLQLSKAAYRIGSDWGQIESETIRDAVLCELRRLHRQQPELSGWNWLGRADPALLDVIAEDTAATDLQAVK